MNTIADQAPADPVSATRRRWMLGAAAVAAGLAGAGVAWWRIEQSESASGRADPLWGLVFDTPSGGTLAMQSLRGKPLVVNFWATWCPPCVEELPLLDRFYRENVAKGWQIVGLAIDQPSAVRKFLARTPVSFPIGMAGLGGTELGLALGNQSGGLPFTVVVGSNGEVLQRKMGRLAEADLGLWNQFR